MRRTLVVLAVLLVSPSLPTARDAALERTLALTSRYVEQFQHDFAQVIGVERYVQEQRGPNRLERARELLSEVFFFGHTSNVGALTVRNVKRVDGRRVRSSAQRIEQALALSAGERFARLKALADASARYNLGAIRRNINEPTLALMFASAELQPRFKFKLDGDDVIGGRLLHRLHYRETSRPSVVRDARTRASIPASGDILVDDAGVVWLTELRLSTGTTVATARVAYQKDERLDVMVPVRMDEEYRYRDSDSVRQTFITGHATYSDYRKFVTYIRIVPPR